MSIWSVKSVDEASTITLVRWRVFETRRHKRHFVVFNVADAEDRVSSAIEQFDPVACTGTTRFGRLCQLRSSPGSDPDALRV